MGLLKGEQLKSGTIIIYDDENEKIRHHWAIVVRSVVLVQV